MRCERQCHGRGTAGWSQLTCRSIYLLCLLPMLRCFEGGGFRFLACLCLRLSKQFLLGYLPARVFLDVYCGATGMQDKLSTVRTALQSWLGCPLASHTPCAPCLRSADVKDDVALFPALLSGVPRDPVGAFFQPRPLSICQANWQGAEADPALLQELIQAERMPALCESFPLFKRRKHTSAQTELPWVA